MNPAGSFIDIVVVQRKIAKSKDNGLWRKEKEGPKEYSSLESCGSGVTSQEGKNANFGFEININSSITLDPLSPHLDLLLGSRWWFGCQKPSTPWFSWFGTGILITLPGSQRRVVTPRRSPSKHAIVYSIRSTQGFNKGGNEKETRGRRKKSYEPVLHSVVTDYTGTPFSFFFSRELWWYYVQVQYTLAPQLKFSPSQGYIRNSGLVSMG